MQLGANVPDSVINERITNLAPNQCCSLIFTVSLQFITASGTVL